MDNNQIMAAISQVQVMPKQTHLGVCEENRLLEALGSKKINSASIEDVKEVLRLTILKVGVRTQNMPNKIEVDVLLSHIYNHYYNHTLEEIKLAFEMAISGKLETQNVKGESITLDANCYESFSCLYFSNIMNAYRAWAGQAHKHLPTKPPPTMISNVHITTQEEKLVDISDIENKNPQHTNLIPPYIFDYLVEFKKINPTNKEKWEAMQRAADTRKTVLFSESLSGIYEKIKNYKDFLVMYNSGEYIGAEPHLIKTLAKQIMVMDYLRTLKIVV